jgi:diacylglycerol O-acyltransferase
VNPTWRRDRLSALDSLFLLLETETQSLHVGSVLILEGPAPRPEQFSSLVAQRVAAVPILHRRVVRMPLELGRPVWADARGFDPADHVHHARLEAPGDGARLRAAVVRIMRPRLDPARPLWEVWQLDGLSGGRWAVVAKAHHTMVDGRSGVDLVGALLADVSRADVHQPAEPAAPPGAASLPPPSVPSLAADLLAWLARAPFRAARLAVRSLRSPRAAAQRLRRLRFGLAQVIRPDLPPSVLAGPLGRERLWGWAEASLDDVRALAERAGCTVNDIFLAALSGAYRSFLLDRGEDLDATVLRAIIPVGGRRLRGAGARRNLASAMFIELPAHLPDPVSRLAAVAARTAEQKATAVAEATAAVVSMADHLPAPLLARAATAYGRARQGRVNVAATSLRGPAEPQWLAGRRVLRLVPYIPVALDVRATAAMVSYAGRLAVGVTADAEALPDAGLLIDAIGGEFARLIESGAEG